MVSAPDALTDKLSRPDPSRALVDVAAPPVVCAAGLAMTTVQLRVTATA
jgi:hypothetical protein